MRILWICNIMLPGIARKLGQEVNHKEGWISGLLDGVLECNKKNPEKTVQLGIAFPVPKGSVRLQDTLVINQDYDIPFYGFRENTNRPEQYDPDMEMDFEEIFAHFKPDMIHIFGTEYPHALAAVKTFKNPERTLIGLQGLCRACGEAYMANLPRKVQRSVTFRDIVKKDTLIRQQQKFEDRGQWELAAIQGTGHVTGRTKWDRSKVERWNPSVRYHSMNETLRGEFYEGTWNPESCEPNRIFFSQGDYPLKGFHYMLLALPQILKQFPRTEVYVAGNSLMRAGNLTGRLKISAYGRYLEKLIRKYKLEEKVHFTGRLSAVQMKEQYLKSQVFVCASSLENSPNSMGEAMLLGVPVVTSYVGGIPSMILPEEGCVYTGFDPAKAEEETELTEISNRLAAAVCHVFSDMEEAKAKAVRAKEHAVRTHDREENNNRLMEIYDEIGKVNGDKG